MRSTEMETIWSHGTDAQKKIADKLRTEHRQGM